MIESIIEGLFSDYWIFEDLVPATKDLINHTYDGCVITKEIYGEAQSLYVYDPITYVDSYNVWSDLSYKYIFANNSYYTQYYFTFFEIKNNVIWNHLNSFQKIYLDTPSFWFTFYPINLEELHWVTIDKTQFKFYVYGFNNSIHDINHLEKRIFQHHDYQVDLCYSTSWFWSNYISTKNVIPGAFIYWHEPFGSVEIILKNGGAPLYQFWYPALEECICLTQTELSDVYWLLSDIRYAHFDYPVYFDTTVYRVFSKDAIKLGLVKWGE